MVVYKAYNAENDVSWKLRELEEEKPMFRTRWTKETLKFCEFGIFRLVNNETKWQNELRTYFKMDQNGSRIKVYSPKDRALISDAKW